jgi:hypothetical protein
MLREDFLGIIIYLHLPFAFHTAPLKAKIDTADPSKQTAERDRVHLPALFLKSSIQNCDGSKTSAEYTATPRAAQ